MAKPSPRLQTRHVVCPKTRHPPCIGRHFTQRAHKCAGHRRYAHAPRWMPCGKKTLALDEVIDGDGLHRVPHVALALEGGADGDLVGLVEVARREDPAAVVDEDLEHGGVYDHADVLDVRDERAATDAALADLVVGEEQLGLAVLVGEGEEVAEGELALALDALDDDVGDLRGDGDGAIPRLLLAAQGVELLGRVLLDAAALLAVAQHARGGEGTAPGGGGVVIGADVVLVVREAHPTDEDGAALLVHERLAGVVVEAVVPVDELMLVDGGARRLGVHALVVEVQDVDDAAVDGEIARGVHVLGGHALGVVGIVGAGHALRAGGEELAAVEDDAVGALPHVAERLCLEVGDRTGHLPLVAVQGVVHHDGAAGIGQGARAEEHVELAVLLPDLGVAHVAAAVRGIAGVVEHDLLGAEVDAVVGLHERLVGEAARGGAVTVAVAHVARVVEPELVLVLVDEGATGIGAVAVAGSVGHHVAAEEDPVHQVAAREVAPAMRAVEVTRVRGGVLAEEVIRALELAEAVGVGNGTAVGCEMQLGTPRIVAHGIPSSGIAPGPSRPTPIISSVSENDFTASSLRQAGAMPWCGASGAPSTPRAPQRRVCA